MERQSTSDLAAEVRDNLFEELIGTVRERARGIPVLDPDVPVPQHLADCLPAKVMVTKIKSPPSDDIEDDGVTEQGETIVKDKASGERYILGKVVTAEEAFQEAMQKPGFSSALMKHIEAQTRAHATGCLCPMGQVATFTIEDIMKERE